MDSITTFETVQIGGWDIKLSKYMDQILVVAYSEVFLECKVEFFTDEPEAMMYIEYLESRFTQDDQYGL